MTPRLKVTERWARSTGLPSRSQAWLGQQADSGSDLAQHPQVMSRSGLRSALLVRIGVKNVVALRFGVLIYETGPWRRSLGSGEMMPWCWWPHSI